MDIFIKKFTLILVLFLTIQFWPKLAFSQYKLEKVKEFKLNSIFPIEFVDYFPNEKILLGFINKFSGGLEIIIVKDNGEIVVGMNLKGEGPEQYASTLNCLGFSDEGNIWALTPHQLLLYNRKLKLMERIRYNPRGQIYIYGAALPFHFFYVNGDPSNFSFISTPSGSSKFSGISNFKDKKLIEVFNLKKTTSYEIGSVSERPQYQNIDNSLDAVYFPIYTVDKSLSKLYLTTSLDNEITVINLNTNQVLSKIIVNHGEFNALKLNSISLKDLPLYGRVYLAARNYKLYLLEGGFVLLEYIREIPFGTYEKKLIDDPTYHHFKDPTYHHLILFNQNEQLSGDIPVPKNGKLMISLPGNRLLFQIVDPDVEEDFVRYEIYEVVKK